MDEVCERLTGCVKMYLFGMRQFVRSFAALLSTASGCICGCFGLTKF